MNFSNKQSSEDGSPTLFGIFPTTYLLLQPFMYPRHFLLPLISSPQEQSLWLRVLKERYGSMCPWAGNPLTISASRKSSIWWRDLALLGVDSHLGSNWFKEVTSKRIGNGVTVLFWTDSWYGTAPLATVFPSVMACHAEKQATVAEMGVWTDSGWAWKWETHGTAAVFGTALDSSSASDIAEFVIFLQGVQLPSNEEDRWVWSIDVPRGFTVKSCYQWMCNQLQEMPQIDERVIDACKALWKSDLPSKVLVFCWRLLIQKLPLRDKLLSRGIISSP